MLWKVTASEGGYQVETDYLAEGAGATGVNTHGEAVGNRMTIDSDLQTWVYEGLYWPSVDDMPVLLAPLPGDNGAAPWKINDDGLIVGRSIRKYETTNEAGQTEIHEETTAAFWSTGFTNSNGELVAVELSGQPSVFSVARDINQCNEDGIAQIVGIVQELGPALWLVDCESLVSVGPIALTPDDMRGWALGINNAGDACGDHGAVPYRVLADGTHEELAIRRNFRANANDIGENRLVVGIVWGVLGATFLFGLWLSFLSAPLARSSSFSLIWLFAFLLEISRTTVINRSDFLFGIPPLLWGAGVLLLLIIPSLRRA